MMTLTYSISALLLAFAWLAYGWLYNWRFRTYKHIPSYYPPSLFMGNLATIGTAVAQLKDPRRHTDYAFEKLWKDAGYPQITLLDLRPLNPPLLLVASHEVAEQISKASKEHTWSVTKSPTMGALLDMIGKKSILVAEGDTWRALRRRFNAGFAPQHLMTLMPVILQKVDRFVAKLDALAISGAEAEMEPLCTNLTFDIIGDVICNLDLKAQDTDSGGHEVVYFFKRLLATYAGQSRLPSLTNLMLRIRRRYYATKADASIKKCIKNSFADVKIAQETGVKDSRNRSVLSLALKDTNDLTSEDLQIAADQVKSFFFAGHDTTSILLQRLFHELSCNPKCLEALRAEHDAVFGEEDPRSVLLSEPEHTMKQLTYTSACIKEALRLWPPAGTARLSVPEKGFKVRLEDGSEVCVDGTILYHNHFLIQRDPRVYGDTACKFVPERWLGNTSTAAADEGEHCVETDDQKIPISAWRPFERGPRNCIGQELANLEARVILACVIRKFDFIKLGAGAVLNDEKGQPIVDEGGRYKTNGELFSVSALSEDHYRDNADSDIDPCHYCKAL
ncbi:unnamed protein product [Periconia digitata]|uniref:Cytochrome P450 n=1 Tax=Periconia digitata TaxID=1303443 RepID=A0A9W4UWM5_9PLEO|nr:unnamed protein product [Periconia digitata]